MSNISKKVADELRSKLKSAMGTSGPSDTTQAPVRKKIRLTFEDQVKAAVDQYALAHPEASAADLILQTDRIANGMRDALKKTPSESTLAEAELNAAFKRLQRHVFSEGIVVNQAITTLAEFRIDKLHDAILDFKATSMTTGGHHRPEDRFMYRKALRAAVKREEQARDIFIAYQLIDASNPIKMVVNIAVAIRNPADKPDPREGFILAVERLTEGVEVTQCELSLMELMSPEMMCKYVNQAARNQAERSQSL